MIETALRSSGLAAYANRLRYGVQWKLFAVRLLHYLKFKHRGCNVSCSNQNYIDDSTMVQSYYLVRTSSVFTEATPYIASHRISSCLQALAS